MVVPDQVASADHSAAALEAPPLPLARAAAGSWAVRNACLLHLHQVPCPRGEAGERHGTLSWFCPSTGHRSKLCLGSMKTISLQQKDPGHKAR